MRPMRGKAGRVRLKVPVITGRRGQSGRGLRALQDLAVLLRFRASRSVLECAQSSAAFCSEHTKLTGNSSHARAGKPGLTMSDGGKYSEGMGNAYDGRDRRRDY